MAKLTLDTPITRRFGPGATMDVTELEVMGRQLHREPEFDEATGDRTGWQAEGSYVRVTLCGRGGHVETVTLAEGQDALDLIDTLDKPGLGARDTQELQEAINQRPDLAGTIA